jgi:hypothetical protein
MQRCDVLSYLRFPETRFIVINPHTRLQRYSGQTLQTADPPPPCIKATVSFVANAGEVCTL